MTVGRTGTVTVKATNAQLEKTFTLHQQTENSYLTVTPSTAKIGSDGGDITLQVSSNISWTATSSDPNFVLKTGRGTGGATVVVSVAKNTDTNIKEATITFTGSGLTATCKLTEEAFVIANEISLRLNGASSGTFPGKKDDTVSYILSLTIQPTTSAWTLTADQDWITLPVTSGTGNMSSISFDLADNNILRRQGTITATHEDGVTKSVVTITQAVAEKVTETLTLKDSEGNTNGSVLFLRDEMKLFIVVSNQELAWTVECDSDWITLPFKSGTGDGYVNVRYSFNSTFEARKAIITAKSGSLSATYELTQAAGEKGYNITFLAGESDNIYYLFSGTPQPDYMQYNAFNYKTVITWYPSIGLAVNTPEGGTKYIKPGEQFFIYAAHINRPNRPWNVSELHELEANDQTILLPYDNYAV